MAENEAEDSVVNKVQGAVEPDLNEMPAPVVVNEQSEHPDDHIEAASDAVDAEAESTSAIGANEGTLTPIDETTLSDGVAIDSSTEDPKAPLYNLSGEDKELGDVEALADAEDTPVTIDDTPLSSSLKGQAKRAPDMSHPLAQEIILDPFKWRIWPAVAVLRWLLRKATRDARRIVYRSEPSLSFSPSEINDIAVDADGIELILNSPGIAAPGSPLPPSDIERIIADKRRGGAIANWLDGPGDRFMHALETAQARNNVAFALAVGARVEPLETTADLVGYSAPLTAQSGGQLSVDRTKTPEGAVGLTSMYLGLEQISAKGLENLFKAFTELPTRVKEFTGKEIPVVKPARLGGEPQNILGAACTQVEAGIEIILEGGSNPEALKWASDVTRRNSLRLLASSYIGTPLPRPTIFLLLNPDNIPSATLDGGCTLGCVSVLGKPQRPMFVPFIR